MFEDRNVLDKGATTVTKEVVDLVPDPRVIVRDSEAAILEKRKNSFILEKKCHFFESPVISWLNL